MLHGNKPMHKGVVWTAWDILVIVIVLAIILTAVVFVLWPKIGEATGWFGGLWTKP